MNSVHDFECQLNDGQSQSLANYKGKVLLIVNTASKCGFTPQYEGLEQLYQQFKTEGLEILAFPCNQFGQQEPGSSEDIQSFCSLNFDVSFPLFSKVDVNGNDAHPLYQFMKKSSKGIFGTESIKWNFTKFLVDQQGKVLKRYAPTVKPQAIKLDIQKLLTA